MKCPHLNESFGFPECYSIFEEPLYPVEFRYEGYCSKENHKNCPFYQAAQANFKGKSKGRERQIQMAA